MNASKMGLFATAALAVLATQANANGTEHKGAAKGKDTMVCANTCSAENAGSCGGKVIKAEKTEEACNKATPAGKWTVKTAEMKPAAPAPKAK